MLSALLMMSDAIIALARGPGHWRFSRVFRPLFLITNSARLRTLLVAMMMTLPNLAEVFGLVFVVLVVYACMGLQLYGGMYSDADGLPLDDNFDTFPRALITLLVLCRFKHAAPSSNQLTEIFVVCSDQ